MTLTETAQEMDGGLLTVAILFVTLALIAFGLRVYVRAFLIRKWGLDDWLISCAIVSGIMLILERR